MGCDNVVEMISYCVVCMYEVGLFFKALHQTLVRVYVKVRNGIITKLWQSITFRLLVCDACVDSKALRFWSIHRLCVCVCVCLCVYMCVFVCVCMYVFVCMCCTCFCLCVCLCVFLTALQHSN